MDRILIAVLKTVPTPIICIRGHEDIIFVNPSFVAAFGYDGEDLVSVSDWWTLAYPEPSDRFTIRRKWSEELRKLNRRDRPLQPFEAAITCKDGSRRVLEVHLSHLPGSYAVEGLYILSMLDVTASRQTQQALEEARRRSEEASLAKTSFLATMSHELKTPLNAIIGFTEMMRSEIWGPLGNEHYKTYVEDVLSSAEHLNALVTDVLDFSKAEAGAVVLSPEETELLPLAKICARIILPRAIKQGVELRLDIAPDISLIADQVVLKRILLNILFNAVKFTPSGGSVSLHACALYDESKRSGTRISIIDTGIGMSAAEIDVALLPFRQVDPSLARRHEGTGLGLPLAKKLTELHRGTLLIESEPGVGTQVSLRLPVLEGV